MVYVILSSWPPQQSMEMGKIAMGLPPVPEYIKRKMLLCGELGLGTKCFDIYEFDTSKYQEAIDYLNLRIVAFLSVPGFTYELRRWYDEEETMNLMAKYMSK